MKSRNFFAFGVIFLLAFMLISIVLEMPTFGDSDNPPLNEVYKLYIEEGIPMTGAQNIVAAVLADFRAYDTLGETAVLFTGIAAVIGTLIAHSGSKDKGSDDHE
jgi:multicomponent Na+:H+ antiporter subunit B